MSAKGIFREALPVTLGVAMVPIAMGTFALIASGIVFGVLAIAKAAGKDSTL